MKRKKKVISDLEKCYSIAPLIYQGRRHILVAAEKHAPCCLFDEEGNLENTVWTEPGGVMSMVQVPGSDGIFLATHKFYSPNDSKEAKIVLALPKADGSWRIKTLADLPHVHRFEIIACNGTNYLIACTLKSGHEYQDDWSKPGKVYAGVLPDDLSSFHEGNQLQLTVIKEGLLKNHGFCKIQGGKGDACIISCEDGVYRFTPPSFPEKDWEIEQLTKDAGSDAVLVDLDEDGEQELVTISPFHGNTVFIYKKTDEGYKRVYSYDQAEFAHAIWGGEFLGKPSVIIGHRKGSRNLLLFTFDKEKGQFEVTILDEDCGPANVFKYDKDGKEILISTNREINEVAMYIFEK